MAQVGVIGVGRLGSALARSLGAAGWTLRCVAGRNAPRARRLAAELGGAGAEVSAVPVTEVLTRAELVFLAVPDAVVGSLCEALPWREHHVVVHTAGALGVDVLAKAGAVGAKVGAFHPLQAFPEGAGLSHFAGISIGIEADAALYPRLQGLCVALGAVPLALAGVDRASYHAAAVFASNCVVALHAAASQAFALAGLPAEAARRALSPLTLGAAQNVANGSLEQALTGPLVRGDVATVARHLGALRGQPELASLYRALGRQLLGLQMPLAPEQRALLEALLAPDAS